MARIPLQTLTAFRAAGRMQNLRSAAEQLHLTPGAVSQQIKHLEQQSGLALFDRVGRGVVLNRAGQTLLSAVESALERLNAGLLAAHAAAQGSAHQLRLTVLPSFAQRWLLPRLGAWQQRHPQIVLDVHASQQLVDLHTEGFHAGLRVGLGPWKGLRAERLIDSPLIAVAAPARAARLPLSDHRALAAEPLLGDNEWWRQFLAQCGCALKGRTVADFNDAGLLLQATEQDLGIGLARELLAADALRAGRLVRVSPMTLELPEAATYWLVSPPELADWAPLAALRQWLFDELDASRAQLQAQRD